MVSILVFFTDFLMTVTRLLQEDLLWLREYCKTLSNWHCLGFILLLLSYRLVMKFFIGWAVVLGRKFLGHIGVIRKVVDNNLLANPDYRVGYKQGYSEGLAERRRREEEERKRREREEEWDGGLLGIPKAWWKPRSWWR